MARVLFIFGLVGQHVARVLSTFGLVALHLRGSCLFLAWALFTFGLACLHKSCLFFDGVLFTFGLDGLQLVRVLFMFGLFVVHIQFN